MRKDGGYRRGARKWDAARQQLVDDDTQRVEIGAAINVAILGLFRRHVLRRPHHGACARQPGASPGPHQAKIHQRRLSAGAEHDIGRLDVAVHDAQVMRVIERLRHLLHHVGGLRQRHGAIVAHPTLQRVALQVLHDEVMQVVNGADIVNGDDMRVMQIGRHDRFLLETLDKVLVGR